MTGTFTEHLKAASPLKGGYPGSAMGMGQWGASAIGDTIAISTTLSSCVIFLTQVYGIMPASGAVVTSVTTSGIVNLTVPAVCSGSWIAIGF
jgi:hypothetical protein